MDSAQHLSAAPGADLMDDELPTRVDPNATPTRTEGEERRREEEVKSRAQSSKVREEDREENENRNQTSMASDEQPEATIDSTVPVQTLTNGSSSSVAEMNVDDSAEAEKSANDNEEGRGGTSGYNDRGFTISWRNLDFVVESKWYKLASGRKPILAGLSGSFKSGELLAVLGPSGAGKSTLIDCLMGKHERGLSGKTRVTFNRLSYELERRKKRPLKIALIPQQDHLLDSLTVTETFMFASRIKNAHLRYEEDGDEIESPASNRRKKKKVRFDHFANVQRVIQQLNLASCAGSRCGKLSGGQYKRVSIGQELLSRPDLMILDEPTSGLDSVTCYQTISALRKLIDSSPYPMAIVATIHQPDVEVFNLFHKAYVLAEGGRAIFEGPGERIFDSVQRGLELVESRWIRRRTENNKSYLPPVLPSLAHNKSAEAQKAGPATSTAADNLKVQGQGEEQRMQELRRQLAQRGSNPARLIVEVAACEFGYAITSAMNEIHRREDCSARFVNSSGPSLSAPLALKLGHNKGRSQNRLVGSLNTITTGLGSVGSSEMCPSQLTLANSSSSNVGDQQAAQPSSPSLSSSSFSMAPNATAADRPRTKSSSGRSRSDSISSTGSSSGISDTMSVAPPQYDYEANAPEKRRPELDKLLNLVAANLNSRRSLGVYLRHLACHTSRSWTTIVRDPMLFSVQVAMHILVPLLISYAFAFHGSGNDACPRFRPLDIVEEAYRREGNVLDDVSRELRTAFENLGYIFFQLYVIIFAAVCCTSLTYPLAMHVLLKEYRNGWYSLSSYFLGRTIADLPIPTLNAIIAMAISYHLTGQPDSPYAWRFVSVASLTVLATLVAQTQGLMFGAMLMNLPQSAVFVAPASTAPLVVVSGFLLRIKSLPAPLQVLSKLSYFTHLINGFVISRYGFNRCPCDESQFDTDDELAKAHQIPVQARTLIDLWVETFADEFNSNSSSNFNATTTSIQVATSNATAATTLLQLGSTDSNATSGAGQVDLLGNLVATISRAKSYGFEMSQCNQVKPFTMLDYELEDSDLYLCFGALALMLLFFRWLTYAVLSWKISSSI